MPLCSRIMHLVYSKAISFILFYWGEGEGGKGWSWECFVLLFYCCGGCCLITCTPWHSWSTVLHTGNIQLFINISGMPESIWKSSRWKNTIVKISQSYLNGFLCLCILILGTLLLTLNNSMHQFSSISWFCNKMPKLLTVTSAVLLPHSALCP